MLRRPRSGRCKGPFVLATRLVALSGIDSAYAAARSLALVWVEGTSDLGNRIADLHAKVNAHAPEADVAAAIDATTAALDAVIPADPVPSGG